VVLGFELSTYTLSHSTSPFFFFFLGASDQTWHMKSQEFGPLVQNFDFKMAQLFFIKPKI
jgi:hypothetical protein